MSSLNLTPRRAGRYFFTGLVIAGVTLAALACSSGDDDPPAATPGTTPGASVPAGAPGTCGPASSNIAKIARDNVRAYSAYPAMIIDPAKQYTAVVRTSKGDITLSLAAAQAPLTVNSFVFLSCHGYYDGLNFHRVVANFVIQGGDPRGDGSGGPGYTFKNEISELKHDTIGTLAMARTAQPDTNGSQWYITTATNANTANLDGSYTVFGKVTSGLDVVQQIRQGDKINSISITEQ